jgi:hypothetical protein
MSNPLIQQLPVLLGVGIGALATYATTFLADRTRWKRERDARWDEARMRAYADYGSAVKKLAHLSRRVAAGRGFSRIAQPLSPSAETTEALTDAEEQRGRAWESVLLLGNHDTIQAGRNWHQAVWRLYGYAVGELTDADQFAPASFEADRVRETFYKCARRDLGVSGGELPTRIIPPWMVQVTGVDANYARQPEASQGPHPESRG